MRAREFFMRWHSETFTTPVIEKLKNLYLNDKNISDVDLSRRFNITIHRLRDLMKKEGVYKLKAERKASRENRVGVSPEIESD
jgi:hypothetical protein